MKTPRLRLAVVVQRYGEEVNGGAELHARWLAEKLAAHHAVEVITTCALDYITWRDHYRPGKDNVNGLTVHRFSVDTPRNWRKFQRQTYAVLHEQHSYEDEVAWVRAQGPYAAGLFEFIKTNHDRYDIFIFFTYLYATTFFGLPLVANKAILVPTAHEEPYLHLPIYRDLLTRPRAFVFNTATEKALVERVTGKEAPTSVIAGVGINVPDHASAGRFRERFQIDDPFLLYVGRIAPSKNVPELLDYFSAFRRKYDKPLKLALAGKPQLALPANPEIVPLGFISEQEKFDALAAATVVVVPSRYESLSMIALEAWLMGKPVMANGRCTVLKAQCRASNGGLYYTSLAEFELILQKLLMSPSLQTQLGQNGHRFVELHYRWDQILDKYSHIFQSMHPAAFS